MASIEVKNAEGAKVSDVELTDAVFGVEPNMHAMHEVVRAQRAARRQCTHNTLNAWSSPRWRQEALASKGHRSCSSGYDPRSTMGRRRYRIRSSSSLLCVQCT